jgi:serine/threonine protein kinase
MFLTQANQPRLRNADREIRDKFHADELAWTFLEAIASALARCHHGLGASQVKGVLSAYSEFQKGWTTILHRDIKPGNGE